MSKTGIVTVLYDSASHLPDFFRSLNGQIRRDFTLYVVDNASPDRSLELAKQLSESVFFKTVFIQNLRNGGVAQGNNRGIAAARNDGCRWILLSNNDTVWQPDTLSVLLKQATENQAEIAVPKITAPPENRIWYAGGGWNRWRGGTRHFKHDRIDRPAPVAYAPSCCMLIHNTVFDRVGTMDERFFLYYDDSDFIRRASDEGIGVWYNPQAVVSHKKVSAGVDSPSTQYWLSRNLLLFTDKHESRMYWHYVFLVNLLILFTKRLFTFGRDEWNASWRGLRDGFGACRKKRSGIILRKAWRG